MKLTVKKVPSETANGGFLLAVIVSYVIVFGVEQIEQHIYLCRALLFLQVLGLSMWSTCIKVGWEKKQ